MKKILLLGGSAQQVVAIDKAKELGLYTVLCDYLPDNPGQFHADRFYSASTTDRDTVLQIAREEKIDGVLAYASDPAAPTAAYVAERLGLPSNPLAAVNILCHKDLFRAYLRQNGFNAPQSGAYTSPEEAGAARDCFHLPVIVKPVDSSGSKGATVLQDWASFDDAAAYALRYSREHRFIVEEYIEKAHPYLVGGDLFVIDGKIVLWGLLNCHRDPAVNALVPAGKSYPLALDREQELRFRDCLQTLVTSLGITSGAMNVELIMDGNGDVWPIDIGPRNGGNMIPDLLAMIFGTDVVEMTVRTAMGEKIPDIVPEGKGFFATYNLHSREEGKLRAIRFADELDTYIVRKNIYVREGDPVHPFTHAAYALGIVFLAFPDKEKMFDILGRIDDLVFIDMDRE